MSGHQQFICFRCDCGDFLCKCDQGPTAVKLTRQKPIEAAEQYHRLTFSFHRSLSPIAVVVQDKHGNRATYAVDNKGAFLTWANQK